MKLLQDWELKKVRAFNVPYGSVERTTAKKRCTCRACGNSIPKGAERLTFFWDYTGSGSWTAVESHIHIDCPNRNVQPPR